MPQIVKRIQDIVIPEGVKLGWVPMIVNNRIVGFENPKFGRYEQVAFCDADTGKFLYDGIRKLDGPIQEDGHSTPSAIMVVVEEKEDGYYLHCIMETRPIIFDHVKQIQGTEVMGFAGGFSKKGEKPSAAAMRELLDEAGIVVDEANVELVGYASDNRASTETCIEIYLGVFRRKTKAQPGQFEIIKGSKVVRIDQFEPGTDMIVNGAYGMVVRKLGLVAPSKRNVVSQIKAKLLEAIAWLDKVEN